MRERNTFENRAPDLSPRHNLTMLAHAEAPTLPKVGDNEQRREVMRKAGLVLPVSTPAQRKRGRPAKPISTPDLAPKAAADRVSALKKHHDEAARAKAREVFGDGPLTTKQFAAIMGHAKPSYALVLLRKWVARGLIIEVPGPGPSWKNSKSWRLA